MNELINIVNRRRALLEKAIKLAAKDEKEQLIGHLRVSKTRGQTRYYKVTGVSDKTGEYLSMKKTDVIKRLAQSDYKKQFIKTAEYELNLLDRFLVNYKNPTEDTYTKSIPERRALVTPYILSDDLIAKEWQSKTFKPNPYEPEKKIFDTRRGEKVRSKSEAIIADTIYELGIPYHYECPVKMVNGKLKYPDFTLLKVRTREIIYFEHFGYMDDEGYRLKTMEKMDLYRASGIYPGKNLIFTYETEHNPLDIKGMRKMLIEMFCEGDA
ncbi:MAG: hypothetical protein IJJ65_04425 [Butyrivibrio sp.]|nr:hypothetical protein [Butyrivibrio sp.]